MVKIKLPGECKQKNFVLENGMKIVIDYGDYEYDSFGGETNYYGKHIRVRLFSKDGDLISSNVFENDLNNNDVANQIMSIISRETFEAGLR
ncbi:MAG: hypothetical protein Q4P14_01110 [Methanobacteriaceae archaeon]|nr:hypothetical protein [Methanobacteriaceae archaeon]